MQVCHSNVNRGYEIFFDFVNFCFTSWVSLCHKRAGMGILFLNASNIIHLLENCRLNYLFNPAIFTFNWHVIKTKRGISFTQNGLCGFWFWCENAVVEKNKSMIETKFDVQKISMYLFGIDEGSNPKRQTAAKNVENGPSKVGWDSCTNLTVFHGTSLLHSQVDYSYGLYVSVWVQ